jgi:hypothetical protein
MEEPYLRNKGQEDTCRERSFSTKVGSGTVQYGLGISKSLQIFLTRKSLISRCLGTEDAFLVVRLIYTV